MFGVHDSGAVGVGKDEVVEFGNEPHRRRNVGRRKRGAVEVGLGEGLHFNRGTLWVLPFCWWMAVWQTFRLCRKLSSKHGAAYVSVGLKGSFDFLL